MMKLRCSAQSIKVSLETLRKGAFRNEERVVLWLGRDRSDLLEVSEVYEPEQNTSIDFFYIPPESMRSLMAHLRKSRMKIVAQLHTHPGRAFHSEADDRWAIIRHVGALSLVLPKFAIDTTVSTFINDVKTFELSTENEWRLVDNHIVEIVP
ncbi:Mov34/MPN/PAD-1 family protein [Rhizobium sp. 2YAF20]|uniref:Mov34/MPN/PAD-1 family protein n=1 Tax=Rhizobium sp. 2YAF20 TaxID=3233027 RepID=UPI003F96379F